MTDDIGSLAKAAYRLGISPVDYAVGSVKDLIDVHRRVAADRQEDPESWPGYCIPLTDEALASRIVGDLMDAGWTPPEITP